MEIKDIIEIIIMLVLGCVSIYFKYNTKLNKKVNEVITEAEEVYKDTTKAGGEKHEYVVNKLYSLIPTPLNLIITKNMVESIVDNTFSEMESYGIKQLDKVVNKVVK